MKTSLNFLTTCKKDLVNIYKHSVESVKPERIIKSVASFDNETLTVKSNQNNKPFNFSLRNRRIHVIGGGKCVLSMASGLAQLAQQSLLTNVFSHGLLSVPIMSMSSYDDDEQTQELLKSIDVQCKFGAKNNLPDENSVIATQGILDKISEAISSDKDLGFESIFILLISGGGSACLSSPRYITLHEKTKLIQDLTRKGADIVELNNVRRYYSNVKGGNLARHILSKNPNSLIISLILSDVIGDPIESIASGPTSVTLTHEESKKLMWGTLKKYDIDMTLNLTESKQAEYTSGSFDNVINLIIGNNKSALTAVFEKASELNYQVSILGDSYNGTTEDVLESILSSIGNTTNSNKRLLVCGGEPTVRLINGQTWGIGGRAQEMALDYMIKRLSSGTVNLADLSSYDVDIFLAGTTDGQDGSTDVAACFASFAEWSEAKDSFKLKDLIHAKQSHDSYNFWSRHKSDWLLKSGPTGTNVMDLYFLLLARDEHD